MNNDDQLIQTVTPEYVSDLLQSAGYRVNRSEQNGVVQLLSASQGIGYAVRFGNRAGEEGAYIDYTYSCVLRIQGGLPAGLVEQWNATRRFGRMSVQGDFLVMEMDVIAARVSRDYLRGTVELWDRLLQEFIVYLREFRNGVANQPGEQVDSAGEPVAATADLATEDAEQEA